MPIAIVGTGYVGLVTAACLAEKGHQVFCVDADPARVEAIAQGLTPIHERGLPELVRRGVAAGRLHATGDLTEAVAAAELSLICVGTPSDEGRIDLSLVERAAAQIGAALRRRDDYHVVAVKSTVVPGSTGGPVRAALERASGRRAGPDFGLAMNPEFLSQGSAVEDFLRPDRIVIGQLDDRSGDVVAAAYAGFGCPTLRTGLVNAEMVKYAANALQATLISFANQIAAICERLPGADEATVMAGVHLDRNLGLPGGQPAPAVRFLRGGIGFGGSCFPKDLVALRHFARARDADTPMLDAVLRINAERPAQVIALLERDLGIVTGRTIAVLGLAFKPDTDDLRESPSLRLIDRLVDLGAAVRAHDPLPLARDNARPLIGRRAALTDTAEAALTGADAAIIATAWPDYRELPWDRLAGLMRRPLLLDGRGLLAGMPLPPALLYRRIGTGRPDPA